MRWVSRAVSMCVCLAALPGRAAQWGLETSLEASGDWLQRTPSNVSVDPSVTGRTASPGSVPLGVGLTLASTAWNEWLVFDDGLLLALFGAKGGMAVGPSTGVIGSVAGSIVEVKPWSAGYLATELGGIGYRLRYRSFALEARLEPWIGWVWMNGTVYSGPSFDANDTPGFALLSIEARVEACWRADPVTRLCAFAAPNLWAGTFLNGGSLGLRWEADTIL